MKQISRYPVILWPQEPAGLARKEIYGRLGNAGEDCHVIMESSNVELSSVYVEKGLGIAFATGIDNEPLLSGRNLEFIPWKHLFKTRHLAVVSRGKADLLITNRDL